MISSKTTHQKKFSVFFFSLEDVLSTLENLRGGSSSHEDSRGGLIQPKISKEDSENISSTHFKNQVTGDRLFKQRIRKVIFHYFSLEDLNSPVFKILSLC